MMSVMKLSSDHVRWLSLIRYQAITAVELSRRPMPVAMLAVNGLHDAVEAMLGLAAEHRGIPLRNRADFLQIFEAVAGEVPEIAHHRSPLKALNDGRVGYKHSGNVLDRMTIERHRVNVMNFLVEASQHTLGQAFEIVNMTGFIADSEARGLVEQAEVLWSAGRSLEALAVLRMAFRRLVRDYEERKAWSPGRSLFTTEPQMRPMRLHGDPQDDHIHTWLEALDERVKLLALGVDLTRYAYFEAHTPLVRYNLGTGSPQEYEPIEGAPDPTDDVFQRCHRFVIDTALSLAEADFDFDAWSMIKAARQAAVDAASGETTS
jgi:hypothetical protein